MKSQLLKKVLPHLIAIIVFAAIALIYCKPALDGQVLQQHDITSWKGSIHQSQEYAKTHDGNYPLWTNALFSGMPAFQIGYKGNNFIPGIVHKIMSVGLPQPAQFFMLACICFYLLAVILRINPWVGMMGALGFAYATYDPVIISVGHDTKMWTIAYMPAVLGSVILIYEKRYWLGAALTALFTSTMIAMNHPQIAYYFFIAAAIMTIFYVVRWAQQKEWKHLVLALGITAAAGLVGVATNAVNVMSTFDYQKATIRGGATALTDTTHKNKTKNGLDRDYAMSYSIDIAEPLVMMVPRMYGGSGDKEEVSSDKSKAIAALQTMPQELQQQLPMMYYWGGIKDVGGNTYTSGPPYSGAIICFLAILACFVGDPKHKWWAVTAIGFTIMMSWGYYFSGFNNFIFDYFPLYNKFRAPSMILVIPQLLLPMLAMLGVDAIVKSTDPKLLWPKFKKALIATGAVFAILFLLYMSFTYLTDSDTKLLKQARDSGQAQLYEAIKGFFDGLKADRKSLFMGDIWRSLGFVALAAGLIFAVIRNLLKPVLAAIALALFVFVDLILVDSKYLGKDNYKDELEVSGAFNPTNFDNAILADTSYFRVANLSGGDENYTSYHFNAVGGYHPAKLSLYQDILLNRLGQEESAVITQLQTNPDSLFVVQTPVLNMLNAKYFIYKQGPETKGMWPNVNALGPCWFVKEIKYVKNADEEMASIASFSPAQTAVVNEVSKASVTSQPVADSTAKITLVKNDNDLINYTSTSATPQFAVFSEIYYEAGWKATIDGKPAPIIKTNYLLRGLSVPAGQHAIEFKFEPASFYKGKKITSIFSMLLIALVIAGFGMEWWKNRKAVA